MKIRVILFMLIVITIFSGISIPLAMGANATNNKSGFIHAYGPDLAVGSQNEKIYLRGVNFTNNYWGNSEEILSSNTKADYENVKNMGMNVIRFCLNSAVFENQNNAGGFNPLAWAWLDKNIAWAKEFGIYLVLDMQAVEGANWRSQDNNADFSLWTDENKQNRVIELWTEIAKRYSQETIIAGYDILNEPITNDADGKAWQKLAQNTVNAVRVSDSNHLVIVERLYGCNGKWELPESADPQFLIEDTNVMYDFHFYWPYEYTHQSASWAAGLGEGGIWPDSGLAILPDDSKWIEAIENNPNIEKGNSAWKYYQGILYCPKSSDAKIGIPVVCASNNKGSAWFDEITVEEYDASGKYLKTLIHEKIQTETGWSYWSEDGKGQFKFDVQAGFNDQSSLSIANAGSSAIWKNPTLAFAVQQGHFYKISGYMKGKSVSKNAECRFTIHFYSDPEGKGLLTRNSDYIGYMLDKWTAFGETHKVPVSVGEFGLIHYCYEKGRGGLQWTNDLLERMIEKDLNFTYWDYHSDTMGIYLGDSKQPTDKAISNLQLIELFKQKLGTCMVSFNSLGGSSVDSESTTYGSKISTPAEPVKAGFIFGGWYKDADCSAPWDFEKDRVKTKIELYAKWTQKSSVPPFLQSCAIFR